MSNKEESFVRLTKEQWIDVAQSLISSCEVLCAGLQKVKDADQSVTGSQYDPDVYAENIKFAVSAIAYVSEYAADRCFFFGVDLAKDNSMQ